MKAPADVLICLGKCQPQDAAGMVVRALPLQVTGLALYAVILAYGAWQRRGAVAVSRG